MYEIAVTIITAKKGGRRCDVKLVGPVIKKLIPNTATPAIMPFCP